MLFSFEKDFIANNGERLSILIGEGGRPMLYPNLFVTSRYRNDEQSSDSCQKSLEHISYFYEVCKDLNIDIIWLTRNHDYSSTKLKTDIYHSINGKVYYD